ncbi:unnamed protein product [Lactuca saligna]|uniref:Zinc-finger domain-containing protein n=1 Tax=Lactuca saligna TaxID=75948 RepID=A0AA35Z477_LACSI|nr:unnamed protein product [Lactuca saligna]
MRRKRSTREDGISYTTSIYDDDVGQKKPRQLAPKKENTGGEEQDKRSQKASSSGKKDGLMPKPKHYAESKGNLVHVSSIICHQCQRNVKGIAVPCSKCTTKLYCVPCIIRWYPNMTEVMLYDCCPVCSDNCNCNSCLRDVHPKVKLKIDFKPDHDQRVRYSLYILHVLFPFLTRLKEEHIKEKAIESKIQE